MRPRSTSKWRHSLSRSMSQQSQIVSFFEGAAVLLTGGTGFLGKLVLERLLRVCGVRLVFLLVRAKKGISDEERFAHLFDKPLFDRLRDAVPDFQTRVVLIRGDCALPQLGISDADWTRLIADVHVVLHCAATVRFDQTLRIAYEINVRATQHLLDKCTRMTQLKSIVYVSTAYTNCTHAEIAERVYAPPMTSSQLDAILTAFSGQDELINRMTPYLLGAYPNTYTFTKCAAEDVVHETARKHNLPLAIVRPTMIMTTFNDPLPGWIDNFYGPIGVTIGAALGVMRSMRCAPQKHADMVPADYVVSATLAAAWNAADECPTIKVYNYAADDLALTWDTFMTKALRHGKSLQSMHAMWPIMLRLNGNAFVHQLSCFWLHMVPAHIVDAITRFRGKPPQMVATYVKLHKFINAIEFFSLREWRFETENVHRLWTRLNAADQTLFEFRIATMDWEEFIPRFLLGGRIHLLKDPASTLPAALRRYRRLEMANAALKIFLVAVVVAFFTFVFRFLF